MTLSTQQLNAIQHTLTHSIGTDLDLGKMLRHFLPRLLKTLHGRSAHLWLPKQQWRRNDPLEPDYSYPQLKTTLSQASPALLTLISAAAHNNWRVDNGAYHPRAQQHFYLFPVGDIGLLAIHSDTELPALLPEVVQSTLPVLKNACLACFKYQDISQYHEAALKTQLIAEQANQSKNEFLATMSHEVRTPTSSILGLVELLLSSNLTEEQHEYVEMIKDSTHTVLEVVDEILDFSRAETGELKLNNRPFSLRHQLLDQLRPLELQAQNNNISLFWRVGHGIPDALLGDYKRLQQVISILLDNAMKFTHQGSITLTVNQQADTETETANLVFTVKDTGIGIPKSKQKKIFHAYQQADTSIQQQYGGSGLGLAIASHIIEKMGGTICVDSEHGIGSTFKFTVLMQIDQTQQAVKSHHITPTEKKEPHRNVVLLAEDNAVNRLVATKLLKKAGYEILLAENGLEARDKWQQHQPNIILMDVQMPKMDGLEASRCIRAIEKQEHLEPVPIIALTASTMKRDRQRCLEAGMNEFLAKPFKFDDLLNLLSLIRRDI